jgi:hypothetical protein
LQWPNAIALSEAINVADCEGFRMPVRRNGEARHQGRRPKPSREGTRES